MKSIKGIVLSQEHWEQMHQHVGGAAPQEACGLIGGKGNRSLVVFPCTNLLSSPTGYRIDPQEQFEVFKQLEQRGWDLLAIYHSHPKGLAVPSPTDIQEAAYPEAVHLIWSRTNGEWSCRAFRIENQQARQINVKVSPPAS
jgi:proteasome lid subunit RPN8/RPN11